jgi:hypothetical protein
MSDSTNTNDTGLTVRDLAQIVEIIKVCSSRGAFRAEELSGVGVLYDRLNSFLQSVTTPAETEESVAAE